MLIGIIGLFLFIILIFIYDFILNSKKIYCEECCTELKPVCEYSHILHIEEHIYNICPNCGKKYYI